MYDPEEILEAICDVNDVNHGRNDDNVTDGFCDLDSFFITQSTSATE